MECPKVLFKWQHSKSYIVPQPTDLFCPTIIFANSTSQKALVCNSLQILREHIHDFPVKQGHSAPSKVWRDLFLKDFHGRWGQFLGGKFNEGLFCMTWSDHHGKGRGVQLGGCKWGLPWSLLCGTTGMRKLCMVPCHICHIYEIWRNIGGECFEVIIWGWQCKDTSFPYISAILTVLYLLRLVRPKRQVKVS